MFRQDSEMFSYMYQIMYRPNEKIPVYRVIGPYLNLMAKPRKFSGFLEKKYLMHFERRNAFQNA